MKAGGYSMVMDVLELGDEVQLWIPGSELSSRLDRIFENRRWLWDKFGWFVDSLSINLNRSL